MPSPICKITEFHYLLHCPSSKPRPLAATGRSPFGGGLVVLTAAPRRWACPEWDFAMLPCFSRQSADEILLRAPSAAADWNGSMMSSVSRLLSALAVLAVTLHALPVKAETGAASPAGRWLAEDIRGGGVIDRLQTVLEIVDDGSIFGTGGCNRMSGKAAISGGRIAFGAIAATKMACAPAAMDQEMKFFAALQDVRAWRVDPARQKLALLDEGGNVVLVFSRI
jgi:heat shock protein HslJ